MLISPCSDWNHKLQAMHGDFMYAFLGCHLAIQPSLKSLPGSAMLHHFHHVLIQVTNYEIYNILCLNKLIYTFTAASCVDIIVNKRLNKYN